MKLDRKRPVLVITGNWNPAIFQPAWIASNLFDIPKGNTVQGQAVELVDQGVPKRILFIEGVGFNLSNSRIELYAYGSSDEATNIVEETALKIINTLPHTPMDAFGCNFWFSEDEPEDNVIDGLKTTDQLDEYYEIKARVLKSTVVLGDDDDCDLNFTAFGNLGSGEVAFDFNYHHKGVSPENARERISGCVKKRKEHALALLKTLYGIEGYETTSLETESKKVQQQEEE